jgi:segregation and condensation protein B
MNDTSISNEVFESEGKEGESTAPIELNRDQLKCVVEAILMAADKVLSLDQLLTLFELHEQPTRQVLKDVISELQLDYSGRGVQLVETASGFSFQTNSFAASWVGRLWEERPQRYSRALLETLALIAYRQPITRGEIEDIRGVSVSSQIVKTMLERNWIRVVGHKEVPGRPAIYATTRQFLDYFGLKSLDQLPPLSDLRDIDAIARDVSRQLELNDIESQTGASSSLDLQEEQQHAPQGSIESDVASAKEQGAAQTYQENETGLNDNTVH